LKNNIPLISFVGYTNAGKSTLFNTFPNKKTKAENRLFSTLDPFLKKCGSPNKEYIISDTVGFIRNLPTSLVIAFRATLEEISYSDLIVHVIDVSDEYVDIKAEVVYSTLEALGIDIRNSDKLFEVHNKIDVSLRQRVAPFLKGLPKKKVFSLSAEKKEGLDHFFKGIEQNIYKEIINENIILDARETVKIQWLYKNQIVKSSELKKDSLKLQLTWNSVQKEMFNRNFGEKVL
jgi:GTP-binding protein HflX